MKKLLFAEWLLIANGFTSLGAMVVHFQQTYLPEYGQGAWYVLKDDLVQVIYLGLGLIALWLKLRREMKSLPDWQHAFDAPDKPTPNK